MFTDTVKSHEPVKLHSKYERRDLAPTLLSAALERIPGFRLERMGHELNVYGGTDGWIAFRLENVGFKLSYVLLANGYPKRVEETMNALDGLDTPEQPTRYTVLIAPWFAPETVATCAARGYGTLDLSGNYRLQFGSVFLERIGAPPPVAEQRSSSSVFAPKSARVLRALFAAPHHAWKVTELAEVTGISTGLVSRVRQHLLERHWAQEQASGIQLRNPEPLLRAWAGAREAHPARVWRGYTLLHGQAFKARILRVMQRSNHGADVLLCGTSAAQWLAPYVTEHREAFVVTPRGADLLKDELDLESQASGENVILHIVDHPEVFLDRVQPAPFLWTTSPVQTFLDLSRSGGRDEDAAEHLLQTYILPVVLGGRPVPESPLWTRLSALQGAAP